MFVKSASKDRKKTRYGLSVWILERSDLKLLEIIKTYKIIFNRNQSSATIDSPKDRSLRPFMTFPCNNSILPWGTLSWWLADKNIYSFSKGSGLSIESFKVSCKQISSHDLTGICWPQFPNHTQYCSNRSINIPVHRCEKVPR